MIIKGVAGSGKTTYLHKLIRDLPNIQVHIYNFEEIKQSDAFMAETFDLQKLYDNNVYKFISVILKEISNIIGKGIKSNDEHKKLISEIFKVYESNFLVTEERLAETDLTEPEQQELFKLLKLYACEEINYKQLSSQMKNVFIGRFNNDESDSLSDLTFIMGFVIRLLFCISRISGNSKHLCVIDNIETFVNYDEKNPIQQCELERIVLGCCNAANRAREILIPIQKIENYSTFYGFLIVMRETTASTALFDLDHYNDFKKENEVDISDWFCSEDIFLNKKNFCLRKGMLFEENCYEKCYRYILRCWGQKLPIVP